MVDDLANHVPRKIEHPPMGANFYPKAQEVSPAPATESTDEMKEFIEALPKVELHVHIEGTLEAEVMLGIAQRNGTADQVMVKADNGDPAKAIERINQSRASFANLQDFLALYNQASTMLRTRKDFFELMSAYIIRCKQNNVRYSEIFFDPQSHLQRGVDLEAVFGGLTDALDAHGPAGQPEHCPHRDRAFSGRLIMSFLRDWKVNPQDDRKPADPSYDGFPSAMEALEQAAPQLAQYKDKICAVGLDNAETFGEPSLFVEVFAAAKAAGIPHAVAHAGEEGTADPFVKDAVKLLNVERLDHGVQTILDPEICKQVAAQGIPLTVCPNSNDRLMVYDHYFDGRRDVVRQLMQNGLKVTLNSDDPAYFGGYMNANVIKATEDSQLTKAELVALMQNAIDATFATEAEKNALAQELAGFADSKLCTV